MHSVANETIRSRVQQANKSWKRLKTTNGNNFQTNRFSCLFWMAHQERLTFRRKLTRIKQPGNKSMLGNKKPQNDARFTFSPLRSEMKLYIVHAKSSRTENAVFGCSYGRSMRMNVCRSYIRAHFGFKRLVKRDAVGLSHYSLDI